MEINTLWRFSVSPGALIGGVNMIKQGADVLILFDYCYGDKMYNSGVVFDFVQVHKYISEMFAKPLNGSLNTLVACTGSEWLNRFVAENAEIALADFGCLRHFAIFFRGYGLYEVFAHDYKILETKEGSLEL